MNRRVSTVLSLAAIALGGCSTIDEKHFLVLLDDKHQPINFFKLEISGQTFLSSSRYVSGFFDEAAVNTYFGTFTQSAGGQFPATQPASVTVGEVQPDGTVKEKSNQAFIMLLSSNADAIADSIGALAQNGALAKDVVRLANRDAFAKQTDAETATAASAGVGDAVVASGTSLIGALADEAPADEAEQKLVAFATQLANLAGKPKSFNTLADVKAAAQ